LLAAMKKLKAS